MRTKIKDVLTKATSVEDIEYDKPFVLLSEGTKRNRFGAPITDSVYIKLNPEKGENSIFEDEGHNVCFNISKERIELLSNSSKLLRLRQLDSLKFEYDSEELDFDSEEE